MNNWGLKMVWRKKLRSIASVAILLAIVLLIKFCHWLIIADGGEELTTWVGESKKISSLPSHIIAPDGELTLFADFKDIRDWNVVLYLANRTGAPIRFDAQDGDLYIKLEFKNDEGKWIRAQTHHYSFCGNSYFYGRELRADHYWKFLGYFPWKGEVKEVRYRRYAGNSKELVSNVGKGHAIPSQVRLAATDRMAIETGDFTFVSKIALGKIYLPNVWNHREIAIYALEQERFKKEDALPILDILLKDDDKDIVNIARRARDSRKNK